MLTPARRPRAIAATAVAVTLLAAAGCSVVPTGPATPGSPATPGTPAAPSIAHPVGPEGAWLDDAYAAGEVTEWALPGELCGLSADATVTLVSSTPDVTITAYRTGTDQQVWQMPGLCSQDSTFGDEAFVFSEGQVKRVEAATGKVLTPKIAIEGDVEQVFHLGRDAEASYLMSSDTDGMFLRAITDAGETRWKIPVPEGMYERRALGEGAALDLPALCLPVSEHIVCTDAQYQQYAAFDARTGATVVPAARAAFAVVPVAEGAIQVASPGRADAASPVVGFDGAPRGEVTGVLSTWGRPFPSTGQGVYLQAADHQGRPAFVGRNGTTFGVQTDVGPGISLADRPLTGLPVGVTASGTAAALLDESGGATVFVRADGSEIRRVPRDLVLGAAVRSGVLVEQYLGQKYVMLLPA